MSERRDIVKEISEITDPKALRIISYLLEEIRQLKEKVARLEKNSSNSSKPPSSDIVKPKHERRHSGERNIGGQKGHPGMKHKLLSPEAMDHITEVPDLKDCPDCGQLLSSNREKNILVQQVAELVARPIELTEYRRYGHCCVHCNKVHYPALPQGVIENQPHGLRAQALISYMKGFCGISYLELRKLFTDVFKVPISRSGLCNVVMRTSVALKSAHEEVGMQIAHEKAVNIDETSWYDSKRYYCAWVFCTPSLAYFSIQASRGSKILKEVLGETFKGAITSDFYSAYVSFANPIQQFCLAHLIRDIKFLTTLDDEDAKVFGETLLASFKLIFKHWHVRDKSPPELTFERIVRIEKKLYHYVLKTQVESRYAYNMKKRLMKHWDSLFRFSRLPELLDPTNNLAERTIRSLVRIRKQTQGSRSMNGRLWNSRIMTVIETSKKRNLNAFDFIWNSLFAKNHHGTYPSLLAA